MANDTERSDVARTFTLGNTRVNICVEYCRRGVEIGVENALEIIARRALGQLPASEATRLCKRKKE